MNHCSQCNAPVDEQLTVCPQCGAELKSNLPGERTVQASPLDQELTGGAADTIHFADAADIDRTLASDDHLASTDEGGVGGDTISAPGVQAHLLPGSVESGDDWDEDDAIDQTLDASVTELDEADDFDFDDTQPGVQSHVPGVHQADKERGTIITGKEDFSTVFMAPESNNAKTVNAFGIPEDASDAVPPATPMVPGDDANTVIGQATIDMSSEEAATQRADDDRPAPHTAGRATVNAASGVGGTEVDEDQAAAAVNGDGAATVVLPGNAASAAGGDKTVVFDSHQAAGSTVEATGTSGTEGRLKRLWEGVAGSSENPMHSLQAVGLQASDSVFQRVATRSLADAGTAKDMSSDYQIIDKLGEGAMGIVYSARQTTVNRVVAIKTAKPNFQNNDESRRRFLYEAHITADLDHSNIVPIHELGATEDGTLFYSMKLVQGTEWSRVLRKKTREQNLEIFMKVTDAMAFAHSKGVIHRDLKPENTMLGRFGEVFVTDWGTAINLDKDTTHLAKPAAKGDKFLTVEDASNFVRGDSLVLHDGYDAYDRVQITNIDDANRNRLYLRKKLTRDYQPSRRLFVVKAMNLAGTPCYMAPEMAGHQLAKIGKTSDIYILGAILYDIVAGRPPHTGDSVTQCLRAALRNEIIQPETDDALLAIAFKAMATNPSERYQSVEELQEAVREYTRHAESIALSDRSDELLKQAIERKDYETFSRTLFGYQDAIDLWPDNNAAVVGLQTARLAFGEAAFAKGDYDLVLQTLDRKVHAEETLYARAVKAKKQSQERESSIRLLKRAVAAVVACAIVGLSGLTWFANNQRLVAVAERIKAEDSAEQERLAKENETAAKLQSQRDAEAAREAEAVAKMEKQRAEEAAELERLAKMAETEAKQKAQESEAKANEARMAAELAEDEAVRQAELAKRRSAQIQLGEYNSSLALAKSQIESFDLAAGSENLARLQSMFAGSAQPAAAAEPAAENDSDVFFGNAPKIETWGWQRIQLLGNLDLPTAALTAGGPAANLDTQVTAAAFAPAAGMAVVGTKQGLIQVLQYVQGRLQPARNLHEPDASISTLAIAPDGQEVVYGFTRGTEHGVRRWNANEESPRDVVSAEKRSFQRFTYTPDGQQLVGGISGGIWLWNLAADWHLQPEPAKRINIRGELTNLQNIDAQHSLLTTRFVDRGASKVLIGILDHSAQTIDLVEMDDSLATRLNSAAHTLVDNRIVLSLNNNQVMLGTLEPTANRITDLSLLEDKHRAPVTQAVSNGQNQLITSSANEPVAHVWRFDAQDRKWEYDTYLTGTPRNLAAVGLLGDDILAVDASGTAIVWNVERQKQRRRLERASVAGSEEYVTPVRAVVAGTSAGQAIAIDSEGVIDLWSLSNGETHRVDGQRWSYFGHTPGAVLVNSAIDLDKQIVVTAAALQNARKQYLTNPEDAWEFCVWHAATGEMLKRWTAPHRRVDERQETIEQRISLVDRGRQLLFASDSETRLVDLNSGRETFVRSDFGSYFAVPNPRTTSQLMLVKRSGAVRMLDVERAASWDEPAFRNYSLADPSDIPLEGAWSEDGQRFYLTFSTGGLAAFAWENDQLQLTWSTRRLQGQAAQLLTALQAGRGRVQSHLDIDLSVETSTGGDTVYIATRSRGLDAVTKLNVLRFAQADAPQLLSSSVEPDVRWLQQRPGQAPELTTRIHDVLVVDSKRVRSRTRVNNQVFVSTTGAQVLALTDGQQQVLSYGRSRLVAASGARDGSMLVALLEDGSLWKFVAEATGGKWTRLSHTSLGATGVQLSPTGERLVITRAGEASLLETETGRSLAELGALQAAAWDPAQQHRLAICRPDGTLEIIDDAGSQAVAEKPLLGQAARVVSLDFFNEVWKDSAKPARQFLLVHSEGEGRGALQFVPLDAAPENAADDQPAVEVIPSGSHVAVSPTENILVTGAPGGTVSVWFAAPTHDRHPHQLFDLEGHRGEDITCLTFSSDGRTIVSADSKNRLYAWLSHDPLIRN